MPIAPTRILEVVGADEAVTPTLVEPVRLVNPDGTDYIPAAGASYTLPPATADALGGVKLQVFAEALGNATENIAAAAEAPTKAEYDALVTAYNALAEQFNRLVKGLSESGVIQLPGSF